VIVVFDARRVAGATETREKIDGVEVIYSREGETADAVIEKLVRNITIRGDIYVATSDNAEQQTILAGGALRLPVTELRVYIENARREMNRRATAKPPVNTLDGHLRGETRQALEKWRRR